MEGGRMIPNAQRILRVAFLVAAWVLPAHAYDPNNRTEYLAKSKQAEALYKEKCEKVAGIKIYKTVPDVEGVLLLKIRPERSDRELADPMWPGAAFGGEVYSDSYITSFLGYEYRGVNKEGVISSERGYINTDKRPGGLPGYRWVEVPDPKDGLRYRYTGSDKIVGKKDPTAYNVQLELKRNPNYDMNVYNWSLNKTPSPSKTSPRYAVTFEDHVIPEERALWVASSTVKVVDLKTRNNRGQTTVFRVRGAVIMVCPQWHYLSILSWIICCCFMSAALRLWRG